MRNLPQPDAREVLKNALKMPDTLSGWIGLVCLVIFVAVLAYFVYFTP